MHGKFSGGIVLAVTLLLNGCRGEAPQINDSVAAVLPYVQVVPLTQKPTGDTGKPLVYQEDAADVDSNATVPSAKKRPVTTPQYIPLEKLKPVLGSSGLVVCEPIAVGADAATAAFGAGCGRWLHLMVGGQAELGQTPQLSSLTRAQAELGRADLRLSPAEADKLATILGITHTAVGHIYGNATHCTLTYQLYAVLHGRTVGGPVQATGTATQVVSQLPGLARLLANRLGVAQPRIPTTVNAGPNDLALLGTLPWFPGDTATASQIAQLKSLAARTPLAGVLLFSAARPELSDAQAAQQTQALLLQAPDNPLIWSLVGHDAPAQISPHQTALTRNLQRFPHSYLFAATKAWLDRSLGHSSSEMQWAEQTVQYAPHNPDAWLTLGWTISQTGEAIRRSRLASEMTETDWRFLNAVYPQWLAAVSRSVQLDPSDGLAWQRVAEAATFAGDIPLADHAFWRSIALQPDSPEAYRWGLEMYQPKWSDAPDAPAKLQKTAQLLATTHFSTFAKSLEAVSCLKIYDNEGHPYRTLLRSMCATLLPHTQQEIARNPGDAQARYDQSYLLDAAGRGSEALKEYKNVLTLRPKDYNTLWRLAKLYDNQHSTPEAIVCYQTLLKISKNDASVHYALGWDLKAAGRFPEAETEMKNAIQIEPDYAEAHFGLGYVYLEEKRPREAIPELKTAARLRPSLVEANQQLCALLNEQGQYDASIAAGLQALRYAPMDGSTMDNMSDDCLHLQEWPHSIQMSQTALQVDPNDAVAHENLGEAYIGQGRKADAYAEWNKVLTLDHGAMAQAAREMLAKHP